DDALAAIEHLGRTSVLEHLPAPRSAGTGSAPFWAGLITTDAHWAAPSPTADPHTAEAPAADLDLIVTRLDPAEAGDAVGDLVAL
ncbi:hypothetical protein AB8O55_30190, partial [Saccharopolyspora cebuensis]